jgi:hypothetical protein
MEIEIGEKPLSHLEQHEADLSVLAEIADLVSKQSGPQQLLTSVLFRSSCCGCSRNANMSAWGAIGP